MLFFGDSPQRGHIEMFHHAGITEIVYRVNAGKDTFSSGNLKKRISANRICKNNLKAGEVK